MNKHKVYLCSFLTLLAWPCFAASEDKSVGLRLSYNYAQSGCQSNNLSCDEESLGGSTYFRHDIFQPYFYQISFDYFGQYNATYPALSDPSQKAKYSGHVFGLGLSTGRVFSFTERQSIVAQLGILPWYVDVKGHELEGDVDNDNKGVSPFASLAYQHTITKHTYLEAGYQYTYGVGADSTGGTNLHQAFFGLGYRFGNHNLK
ncbi:DUF3575 domain-containing protein [Vibrio rumoiensis]|uniref:DUF3575 domain-containing protein n=1 Tax=Vibrio rumoiensis TaxID=76258 RepID=A0ABW7IVA0_9VIBR|nr:DUF3575 domain-containing protein [Vibrio rumoiensis]